MNPIRRELLKYVNQQWTDADELAGLCDCSKRNIYKVLNGEAELKADQMRILCQHFSNQGRLTLSYLFLDPQWAINRRGEAQVNGSILDEVADIVGCVTELRKNFDRGDKEKASAAIDSCRNVLDRADAEVKTRS